MRDHRPSRHHIKARARRGGNKNNIVVLPQDFHNALHTVVDLLGPAEIPRFFEALLKPNTSWTWKEIVELRNDIMRGTR